MLFASLLSLAALAAATPLMQDSQFHARDVKSFTSWMANEKSIALQGMLNNIGANGSLVAAGGAFPGVVVASPSTDNPNYFYTWTRDSALTFKALIDQFIGGDDSLEPLIREYITGIANIQSVSNLSGGLCTGGLGDPKFYTNETAFTDPWGRPQRDGPALRVIAMTTYAKYLLNKGDAMASAQVENIIWPIVRNDLNYVTTYWNETTFDLWEEVDSSSFWTTAVQYRSLVEGNWLADAVGDSCPSCESQAPNVLCFLQSYWNGEYAIANTGGGRSGLDANTILTSIHVFDKGATCDATTWQPCSDKALANHKAVTDSFRSIYGVNAGIANGSGVSVGRYPEDVYYGGNPWYLSTLAAAEQLYDAVYTWKRQGTVNVTDISLPFFQAIYPSAAVGSYASGTQTYTDLISAVNTYAHSYMLIFKKYTPSNGSLSEEYGRDNGLPLSAYDLTWSFASFVTANHARKAAQKASSSSSGASWGSDTFSLPAVCSNSSAAGTCAVATNTNWTDPTAPSAAACEITFKEIVTTVPGQSVSLTGNITQLGFWQVDIGVQLSAANYTSDDHLWFGTANLPVGLSFEYKYAIENADGSVTWQSGDNLIYTVPATCPTTVSGTFS